jgi:4-diphosphocytidyl-2-C-methyl-D-erythritol kinase
MAVKRRVGPASAAGPVLREKAFAKVNLTLRILGRRADGYHEIESLVVFADVGDRLALHPGNDLSLEVRGALAAQAGPVEQNLVIRAARALSQNVPDLKVGRFTLVKQVPAQAGLGGGSADAAAALRVLARLNHMESDDPRLAKAARETGADVPVCLDPRPRWMRGIGEILSPPVDVPRVHAVLVRPDVALATKDVFAALNAPALAGGIAPGFRSIAPEKRALIAFLAAGSNDLERPAIAIAPVVGDVLTLLRAQPSCQLARMSGSGSACFGLFATRDAAATAKRRISATNPGWWAVQVVLGGAAKARPRV